MANETLFTDILTRLRPGYKVGGTVGSTPETKKLIELLNEIKPGDSFNQSDLSKKSGVSRKLVGEYLKKLYPQLGRGTGTKDAGRKLGDRAKDAADVEYKKLLDEGFLEDYKKRIQYPKSAAGSSLSNRALAKKYFPNVSEVAAFGRLERAAKRIRKDNPELIYKKGDPQAAYIKRQERKNLYKPSEDEAKILRQQNAQKKILNKYFQKNPEQLLKKSKVKKMLDAKLVDGKLDFSPRYKNKKDYINLAKAGKLFDEFDVTPIRSEKRNIQFPVNKNVGVGKFNQGFIRQVDAYYKKNKGSTDPKVLSNKRKISNYLNSVGIRVEVEGERIGAKTLPAIDRKTGELSNIKNTLNKLGVGNLSLNTYVPPKTRNITKALDKILGVGKAVARPVLRAAAPIIPFAGPAIMAMGAADVAEAAEKGAIGLDESPVAYYLGPEAAVGLMNLKARAQRGELPDLADETDFTSFRNGGIVAVKGVN